MDANVAECFTDQMKAKRNFWVEQTKVSEGKIKARGVIFKGEFVSGKRQKNQKPEVGLL